MAEFRLTFDLERALPGEHPGRRCAEYCRACAGARSTWTCCVSADRIITPQSEEDADVSAWQAV